VLGAVLTYEILLACAVGEFRKSLDKDVMGQKRLAKSRSRLLETSQVILVWES
jgi:hypothetical protein